MLATLAACCGRAAAADSSRGAAQDAQRPADPAPGLTMTTQRGHRQLPRRAILARTQPLPVDLPHCQPTSTTTTKSKSTLRWPARPAPAGVNPIPASSGRVTRHRLNRSGDRQLNRALHTIVLARLRDDPQTRAYAARRRGEGKSIRDIRRCLKRRSPASCSNCWNATTTRR